MAGWARLGWWLTYSVAALLTFFSFLSTLVLPVVHGMHLLGYRSRRCLLKKWLVCQLVVFALFGWWFVNGTHFWQVWMGSGALAEVGEIHAI